MEYYILIYIIEVYKKSLILLYSIFYITERLRERKSISYETKQHTFVVKTAHKCSEIST